MDDTILVHFTNNTPFAVTFAVNGGAGLATSLGAGESADLGVVVNPGVAPVVSIQQDTGEWLDFAVAANGNYQFSVEGGKIKNSLADGFKDADLPATGFEPTSPIMGGSPSDQSTTEPEEETVEPEQVSSQTAGPAIATGASGPPFIGGGFPGALGPGGPVITPPTTPIIGGQPQPTSVDPQAPTPPPDGQVFMPHPQAPTPPPDGHVFIPDSHGAAPFDPNFHPLDRQSRIATSVTTINHTAIGNDTYHGNCSYAVTLAVNAGLPPGAARLPVVIMGSSGAARGGLMGPQLEHVGYKKQPLMGYEPQPGDVAVVPGFVGDNRCGGTPCGHVAMFNGNHWVSDTFQSHGPNPYGNKPLTGPIAYYRRL